MLKAAGNRAAGNGRAARLSRPCRALPAAAAARNARHLLVAAACWLLPAAAAFAESPSGFPLLDAGKHWPDTNTTLESGSGSLVFFLIAGGSLVVLLAAGSFLLRLWLSGRRRQAELLAAGMGNQMLVAGMPRAAVTAGPTARAHPAPVHTLQPSQLT